MGKRIGLALLVLVCLLALTGCQCEHSWEDATCEVAQTCSKCGQIQGLTEKHSWKDATCEEPQTCEGCGKTQGEAAGHRFAENSCESKCEVCGAIDPAATGHSWAEATCETPRYCFACGLMEGEALGHTWAEATCQMPKTCTRCSKIDGWRLGHELGILDTGAVRKNGICSNCNKMIENFYHRDKIYGWTEYDMAADGSYGEPVTYVRGASITFNQRGEFVKVEWFKDGVQQYYAATQVDNQLTCVAFYKDGKVYYFSLNEFNNAPVVKSILLNIAKKYIAFDGSSFDYFDGIYYPNYTYLRLYGPGGEEKDSIGYVRTAYDHKRNAYTIVVNDRTGEIWVDAGTWKY